MRSTDAMKTTEDKLYRIAATEVLTKTFDPGLMAKAYSDADGNPDKTIAGYIRLRVGQLHEKPDAATDMPEAPTPEPDSGHVSRPESLLPAPSDESSCGTCQYYTENGCIDLRLHKGHCGKHDQPTFRFWHCSEYCRRHSA
ncbi:MAG: hypothetical protein HY343_00150 [Lentisphaerae bacterium]|nr:hypothetical protein [Lentisphaerota bacterium]